ncbi:NHL repeat-containing protein [Leptospira semungkisensis]|nr:NHL repeat-containing protein [Leptospira semungkisensis]
MICRSIFPMGRPLAFAGFFFFFLQCGAINKEAPCDPSNDAYIKNQLIKFLLNDTSSTCAISLQECGALKQGEAATIVLGQPNFTTATAGGSSANQFSPSGIALDHKGGLWISDGNTNRALHFSAPFSNFQNADIILTGSNVPRGISVDANGGLWVTNSLGDSVFHYAAGMTSSSTYDIMLGTGTGTTTQNTMNNPFDVTVDSAGGVWVTDYFNSRALHYSPPLTTSMNADIVLGHPDFTTGGGGTSQSKFSTAFGVGVDPTGNVWIADTGNHRVLRFTPPFTNGMDADLVLGQPDFVSNTGGTSQTSLYNPNAVTFASNGAVWVGESSNTRAVRFSPPFTNGQAADNVIGQPDFVSTNTTAAVSDKEVYGVPGLTMAPCGLWVVDGSNSRVLFFP